MKLKEVDYLFILGTVFCSIVFILTIYGVSVGYTETNTNYENLTSQALIYAFSLIWIVFLMVHVLFRDKLYLSLPWSSAICGFFFFNMLHDLVVVVL